MSTAVLDREMFSVPRAARLLNVPTSTLTYWLDGGRRQGRDYQPILRRERVDRRTVTWAEFIEAGLLSMYRRTHRVPMSELRAFIELLRNELGVPYPLADRRPYVFDRQLVERVQLDVGLDPDFCLVAQVSGQLILTSPSERFLERVEWDGDVAVGWRPTAERRSPVRISPEVRFGRPEIRGISTASIWEHEDAGESVEEIADTFDLTVPEVRWALAYENSERAQGRSAA